MRTLRIGIAGAGIGGLALASMLARAGVQVTVFDQFEAPRPVGSGLVIQPVGQMVLAELGALDAALAAGNRIYRMAGRDAESGRRVLDVSYDASGDPRFGLAIHRAALFDILLDAAQAQGVAVTPGHRATDVVRDARQGMTLRFAEGPCAGPFDMIVDATGAGSRLSPLRSRALPFGALWSTVDWPTNTALPRTDLRQAYVAAHKMVGILPLGTMPGQEGRKAAIFWSLRTDAHEDWCRAGLAAWKTEATRIWPKFAPFCDQITAPEQMVFAQYSHGTLARPYDDGITYIGDAAHRASPQLGQGANMALLDAIALARALEKANGDVALAQRFYAQARRWHVRAYQAMSWAFTPQYQSDSRSLPWIRDRILFPISQVRPANALLTRLVCGDLLPPIGSLG
ncbi:NAD(P)/FAD-dependent oxidoreductase [Cognatishimia sp. F0-27]|uniref:FAD-dependent oxidoreductase n=1 Tax=Cognatishimia sp. F0-27 TaxID=2816855 RepID=UPI001D0C3D3F|nr:NAD(P)/FAD-dependent oxidoreductase [Cognatishimia sp. F0-27]MCC1492073.1 FAD-dependent monooxygenase [Cognatishimia sp. F0-27]